ncbi:transposase, partial [Brachybacterium paraconglomeratum]|uniref:transposase n=1 Tax=Brachybacterium paraconglomeratum TaxID=173362 RepID=UPI0022AF1799
MSGRRRIATQDDMDEVLGLLEDGLSMSAVARELGWDRHTISRWSREAGYTPSFGNKGGFRLVVQDHPAEVVSDVHTPGHGRRLD